MPNRKKECEDSILMELIDYLNIYPIDKWTLKDKSKIFDVLTSVENQIKATGEQDDSCTS